MDKLSRQEKWRLIWENIREESVAGCPLDITEFSGDAEFLNRQDEESGYTLLHCAAGFRNVEMLEALLACGADKNILDSEHKTALDIVKEKIFPEMPYTTAQQKCIELLED